jgi:hypothetical protein
VTGARLGYAFRGICSLITGVLVVPNVAAYQAPASVAVMLAAFVGCGACAFTAGCFLQRAAGGDEGEP